MLGSADCAAGGVVIWRVGWRHVQVHCQPDVCWFAGWLTGWLDRWMARQLAAGVEVITERRRVRGGAERYLKCSWLLWCKMTCGTLSVLIQDSAGLSPCICLLCWHHCVFMFKYYYLNVYSFVLLNAWMNSKSASTAQFVMNTEHPGKCQKITDAKCKNMLFIVLPVFTACITDYSASFARSDSILILFAFTIRDWISTMCIPIISSSWVFHLCSRLV